MPVLPVSTSLGAVRLHRPTNSQQHKKTAPRAQARSTVIIFCDYATTYIILNLLDEKYYRRGYTCSPCGLRWYGCRGTLYRQCLSTLTLPTACLYFHRRLLYLSIHLCHFHIWISGLSIGLPWIWIPSHNGKAACVRHRLSAVSIYRPARYNDLPLSNRGTHQSRVLHSGNQSHVSAMVYSIFPNLILPETQSGLSYENNNPSQTPDSSQKDLLLYT